MASAIELMWPGVPVTAWATMKPRLSKTPAERSPASRTMDVKDVRCRAAACSLTTPISRFQQISSVTGSSRLMASSGSRACSGGVASRGRPARQQRMRRARGRARLRQEEGRDEEGMPRQLDQAHLALVAHPARPQARLLEPRAIGGIQAVVAVVVLHRVGPSVQARGERAGLELDRVRLAD